MATSPTQRSLAHLRKRGCIVQVVERWNAFAKRRIDLFGIVDLVALDINQGRTIGIQTTVGSSLSARLDKALSDGVAEKLRAWLACGNLFEFHGWRKLVKSRRWEVRTITARIDGGAIVFEEVESACK